MFATSADTSSVLTQRVTFTKFDRSLREILGLVAPAPVDPNFAFGQLDYLESYLRDDEIECSLVAVEDHYIDRDFMEDFSVFYSRSLSNFDNYCRRLHFFCGDPNLVEREFRELTLSRRKLGSELFKRRSHRFSRRHYLGFSVIKPLRGTPVGRTALRPFPDQPGPGTTRGMVRRFPATRRYHSHLLGVELSVRGLAFQQQDVGVAACATTAIWTSLQKNREKEELGVTTPAHITARATQDQLPFGRSMPSEGLSIDQMCQAVQSFGLSPVLSPGKDFLAIRATLYAALQSDLCPVLVIERAEPGHTDEYHAVAVVGMKVSDRPQAIVQADYFQASDRLAALFVHDDRYGPYLLAPLSQSTEGIELRIRIRKNPRVLDTDTGEFQIDGATEDSSERWLVSHVLIPTHTKLRLSFPELQEIGLRVLQTIDSSLGPQLNQRDQIAKHIDFWVARSHAYVDTVASARAPFTSEQAVALVESVALSRYLGIVRLEFSEFGTVDVIVDTTSGARLSF